MISRKNLPVVLLATREDHFDFMILNQVILLVSHFVGIKTNILKNNLSFCHK